MTSVTHPARIMLDHPATFGCLTDVKQVYKWHWMKNGQIIAGAPSAASYSTPPIQQSDMGNKYSITVYGRGGEVETSEEVMLAMEVKKSVVKERI
jgi:hypothetical protein